MWQVKALLNETLFFKRNSNFPFQRCDSLWVIHRCSDSLFALCFSTQYFRRCELSIRKIITKQHQIITQSSRNVCVTALAIVLRTKLMMYFLDKPEKLLLKMSLKTTTKKLIIFLFFSEIDKSYILGFGIVCNMIHL